MFNIFPKFGSPGDCASVDDLIGKPATNWFYTSTPTFTINGKTYKADELSQFIGEILTENQKLKNELKSIEEDGTKEHNAAVKLRQENAQLKVDLENWKKGVIAWRTQYDQEVAKNTKLEDEILEYKKGNRNWMNLYQEVVDKNNELLKEVNGLRHLKKENVELMERVNEIDSNQNEGYRAEILTLKNDIAVLKNRNLEILKMYNGMVTQGGLKYMEAKLQIVQNNYTKCSKERDEFKHQLNAANKEIEALKSKLRDYQDKYTESFSNNDMDKLQRVIDEQKEELKKLKEDIIDYVIKKDDELTKVQEQNRQQHGVEIEKVYVCNHCGYKIGHDTNYYGGCGFCKEGKMIEKEEVIQKHPMYPIHWGGWDKEVPIEESKPWKCPCNKCKENRK